MASIAIYIGAAFAEVAGCFAFWAWLKLGKPIWWIFPGVFSLVIFALLLTKIDSDFAGRAFAAYGGVYISASSFWLWIIEQNMPDRWDFIGSVICFLGAGVILFGPRA